MRLNKSPKRAKLLKFLKFRREIYTHYRSEKRKFPWRETRNAYHILVSEFMLQQTQTERVVPKYLAWIERFPDFKTLAKAPLRSVLQTWQGLGYNRRALYLHLLAKQVQEEFKGRLPKDVAVLRKFKGVGDYTAQAILVFGFNEPYPLLETNIRTVFIKYFFGPQRKVTDKELLPLILASIDKKNPREWFYALMDYGVKLKREHRGIGKRSAHYVKQSPFKGSRRELRGKIIRLLAQSERQTSIRRLALQVNVSQVKLMSVLKPLSKEGLLQIQNSLVRLNSI